MPTYDLTCKDCDEQVELFITRLLKDCDKVCPRCGSHEMRVGVGGGILNVRASSGAIGGGGCGSGGFA